MKTQFYIYVHCKPTGMPFYVGKGHGNRAYNLTRKEWHAHVVEKYGIENIQIFVHVCESEAHAYICERWLISYGRAHKWPLVNLTDGGEGCSGLPCSPEKKAKLSAASLGNKNMVGRHHSAETRLKISRAKNGKPSWNKGKKFSAESREKMSIAKKGKPNYKLRGRKHSAETIAKMSSVRKEYWRTHDHPRHMQGKHPSKEARAKMSNAALGNQRARGHKHSPETRAKMTASHLMRYALRTSIPSRSTT